jgi:hypothetical protein
VKCAARVCCAWLVVHALVSTTTAAQETRADAIADAQAEKARQLAPYQPSKAERIFADVKRRLLETPDGAYPWFDSVYSGGGFTLGGGYRQFYGDQTFWTVRGLYSAKNYKLIEVATDSLGLARGRINLYAVGGWRDATQVAYYGLGSDTTIEAQSNFRMQQGYGGVLARTRGPGPVVVDAGFRYEDYTLTSGQGSSPSIEDVYNADTAPGLGANPNYYHMTLGGGIDTRPSPGYARRGGLYFLTYDAFNDPDGVHSFDQLQAEIVHHVPILRENWVFSMHGAVKTILDDDSSVPYFLMPSLGSGSTLRAYPSWRFRDRHSMLLSGEWRWMPSLLFLDIAIFYDTGKVVSRREDLNFTGLTHNWGVGARFHGMLATPLRIELARGSEGFNLVFSGAAAF